MAALTATDTVASAERCKVVLGLRTALRWVRDHIISIADVHPVEVDQLQVIATN